MSIRITCDHCRASYKIKERYAGKRGACPFCGELIVVPPLPPPPPRNFDVDFGLADEADLQSNSSLSLAHLRMTPCPSCNKSNLDGSPSCFHCGAELPAAQAEW